jgi:hypothetical protein
MVIQNKEQSARRPLSALTNLFVLFVSIGMLAVLGFIRWVNIGQWPDTLRSAVVIVISMACFGFVFLRRARGFVPRLQTASTLTISVWYAVGLVACLLVAATLMTWVLVRPSSIH